jgi:quercetin dioxygenase-like cupin family protein
MPGSQVAVVRLAKTCFLLWAAVAMLPAVVSAQVPVHEEPHHHIVFENEALRVLDVNIQAGDTTLDHTHHNDIAILCIKNCDLRTRPLGGNWGNVSVRMPSEISATAYAGDPIIHRHWNVGDGPYRAISVESLRQTGWSQKQASPESAGTKWTKETRAFRIYDVHLLPGKSRPEHIHTSSTIAVLVNGAVTSSEAAGRNVLDSPGSWVFIPAGKTHKITARGNSEVRVVEIEVR